MHERPKGDDLQSALLSGRATAQKLYVIIIPTKIQPYMCRTSKCVPMNENGMSSSETSFSSLLARSSLIIGINARETKAIASTELLSGNVWYAIKSEIVVMAKAMKKRVIGCLSAPSVVISDSSTITAKQP